jgi:hypothetical protein
MPHYALTLTGRMTIALTAVSMTVGFAIGRIF